MTSLTLEDQVLKTDQRGRVRVPRERREALLAEFARSGASAAAFARLVGVKYATFAGWVAQQRRREAAAGKPAVAGPTVGGGPVRLFEALLEAAPAPTRGLAVELPGGARLVLTESAQVPLAAELLAALAPTGGMGGRPC
jgi:transposase-like protein